MDAEFKKGQICTLFVWMGALEGFLGGGGFPQDLDPKRIRAFQKFLMNTLLPIWYLCIYILGVW